MVELVVVGTMIVEKVVLTEVEEAGEREGSEGGDGGGGGDRWVGNACRQNISIRT